MKKLYTILVAVLLTATTFAQAPEKMSYQAVVRDGSDNLVTNATTPIQISILQGSTTGTAVYVETQTPSTNTNGLLSIEIGGSSATVVSGTFSNIDWSTGTHFIKTEIDVDNSGGFDVTGTSQLLSVPYALHAKTAGNTFSGDYNDLTNQPTIPTVTTYAVGDFAKGGIVFWVDETGQHGLVCTKQDQGAALWYAGTYGNTQAKGDVVYAGKANTTIVIAAQVAIGDDNTSYAARICNELQITESGITYGDWYLPSKYELNQMHVNRVAINATATANGGASFLDNVYWSSTEVSNLNAWAQIFNTGQFSVGKAIPGFVRAVRAF